ncbi:4-hydroxy-2-oxovalerate aldolase [Chloroflexota bacterium]|nr:4-hydroxy-2-oxovalerate aldolase [Chloroflexota bacterium]
MTLTWVATVWFWDGLAEKFTEFNKGRWLHEIRPNRIKHKLAEGKTCFVLGGVADPDMIDQLGSCGADGFWLEGEHGPVDFDNVANLTRACDLWGVTSLARVHFNEYGSIYRMLDRGVQGLVMPHVNNRAEAEAFVRAAKFAPVGKRGMFTSRQGFNVPDYFEVANSETLLVVLIEDIAALAQLDEILKVAHVDVFFVAPSESGGFDGAHWQSRSSGCAGCLARCVANHCESGLLCRYHNRS